MKGESDLKSVTSLKDYLLIFRGKTTISNAGILKRVFRKPPGAPGRVRVEDGQVRLG